MFFPTESLHLTDNQFTGSLPNSFESLTGLVELVLGINQFSGSIPTSLENLENLGTSHLIFRCAPVAKIISSIYV